MRRGFGFHERILSRPEIMCTSRAEPRGAHVTDHEPLLPVSSMRSRLPHFICLVKPCSLWWPQAETKVDAAQKVISAVRSLRSDYGLTKEKSSVSLTCADASLAPGLVECAALIATLSTSASVILLQVGQRWPHILVLETPGSH